MKSCRNPLWGFRNADEKERRERRTKMIMRGEEVLVDGTKSIVAYRILIS